MAVLFLMCKNYNFSLCGVVREVRNEELDGTYGRHGETSAYKIGAGKLECKLTTGGGVSIVNLTVLKLELSK